MPESTELGGVNHSYCPLAVSGANWSIRFQSIPTEEVLLKGEMPTLESFLDSCEAMNVARVVLHSLYIAAKIAFERSYHA